MQRNDTDYRAASFLSLSLSLTFSLCEQVSRIPSRTETLARRGTFRYAPSGHSRRRRHFRQSGFSVFETISGLFLNLVSDQLDSLSIRC